MAINTIVCPVGIIKFQKKVNKLFTDEWVDRWAIIDKAGISIANVDGEETAIEIALLINREDKSESDYVYRDGFDYSRLFEIGKDNYKNEFTLTV